MILAFRPELQNPPMAAESTIAFSFINGNGNSEYAQLTGGVNRDFSEETWEKIKGYDVVKTLLTIGALRIVEEESPELVSPEVAAKEGITTLSLTDALTLIEDSFDLEQLRKWDVKESRIRVKNAISKRISAITEGAG
jgi:hypothetical protein